jgi:adenylate kinase family enzyme
VPVAVHITGASGCGVTTLGAALAARLEIRHLDTDDFFWLPTDPPYRVVRPVPERLRLLNGAFAAAGPKGWVLSGNISKWAEPIVPLFGLVVFLFAPLHVRLARLEERQTARFGKPAPSPEGQAPTGRERFLAWAASYDTATGPGRSRRNHETWLAKLSCPVLRLDATETTQRMADRVVKVLDASS